VEHLAAYKVPVDIRIVDDLPRTGPDKVRKDKVRQLFETKDDPKGTFASWSARRRSLGSK
jgi:acyl-coenzyme A synthetase/AMP-(fatty) acid ligase